MDVEIMGPHDGSVRPNDRMPLKPIDVIQENVEVRLIPTSQVVTQIA
jgi:hypothetical protein